MLGLSEKLHMDGGGILSYTALSHMEDSMRKPRVEKKCVICGAGFSVVSSRSESAKTCGLVCRGKFIANVQDSKRVRLSCKACSKVFAVPKSHEARRVYCSMGCADSHRNDNMAQGEESPNWKGGRTMHSCGYVYVSSIGHPYISKSHGHYVFEHRLVIESVMREKAPGHHFLICHDGVEYLRPEVWVHHADRDRQNNAIGNLVACTPSAHVQIHAGITPMQEHVWAEAGTPLN